MEWNLLKNYGLKFHKWCLIQLIDFKSSWEQAGFICVKWVKIKILLLLGSST